VPILNRPPIEVFIKNFKRDFNEEELIRVFTEGNCYHFAVILNNVYPEGRIIYSQILGHFLLEIAGEHYDITGKVTKPIPDITYFDTLYYTDSSLYRELLRDCVLRIDWYPGRREEYYSE
jgi:hypothetical protein